jgi:Homeodomain-like domain-containing protein
VGVIICAAVSAFANASGSLQDYAPVNLNHTPVWMQSLAPWLSMIFPAMIVILSMTTDHILDHAPARGVDVDTFRAREQKRVDLLQVRLDTERALLTLESELATLRRNREQDSGHVQREWIIWHWLRPAVPAHSNIPKEERKTEIDQALQTIRTVLEERVEELRTTLRTQETHVSTWITEVDGHLRTLGTQVEQIQAHMGTLAISNVGTSTTQKPDAPDGQVAPTTQSAPTRRGRMPTLDNQDGTVDSDAEPGEQESTAGSLLATFQRFGASTPDAKIARDVGCSRRTVARLRKRFQEQGLLSVVAQSEEL